MRQSYHNVKFILFILILIAVFSCFNPNYNKITRAKNDISITSVYDSIKLSKEHKAEITQINSLKIGDSTFVATVDTKGLILIRKLSFGNLTSPRLLFDAKFVDLKSVIALSPNFR